MNRTVKDREKRKPQACESAVKNGLQGTSSLQYTCPYKTPLGSMLLAADDIGLTGAWFSGAKHFAATLSPEHKEKDLPIFKDAKRFLDRYFLGHRPEFTVPVHFIGTPFQRDVFEILMEIPYGKTTTYAAIAALIAKKRGLTKMSAQAVGGAVGRNPISIMVPCHRVVGTNGALTGYAGGLDKKAALLTLEGLAINNDTLCVFSDICL